VFSSPSVPLPIRERIAREVFEVTSDPAYQQKLRRSGFEPLPLNGAATERMYREELRQWTALIKGRGLAGR
jgi:tripartite-type tricarboxylate transporter receptor subunit TctC